MKTLTKILILTPLITMPAGTALFSPAKTQGPLQQVDVLRMPPVDVERLTMEDQQRASRGEPARFAQAIPVNVSPLTRGTWEKVGADTMVWRLRIISAGALSLNFGFERYSMPPGGNLRLYTPDQAQIIGPFTTKDNAVHGQLWTPLLENEEVVLEVTIPAAAASQLDLLLTSVNHGYVEFGQPSLIQSGACNIDVACPVADNWRNEIRSVARYIIGGNFLCSGSLINNTAQDLAPYFLTANHCEFNGDNIFDAGDAASMVFYWNYETSICSGTPDGSLAQTSSGAIFRSANTASDFALVELDNPIDPAFNVHWAGWDNSGANTISSTTIHHPGGDEKRISVDNNPTTITSHLSVVIPGDGTHFRIADWDLGTTEGGSSGSPLFDQNHRVVGQLHGGWAACGNNLPDWFGRLFVSWNGGGTPATRLRDWLDPLNTGAATLDGRDYYFNFLPIILKN